MSDELRLPDELAATEARLAAMSLAPSGINRDELMYRAGWAACEASRWGLAPSPSPARASDRIRLAASSLSSAAIAASMAIAATLTWQANGRTQLADSKASPPVEVAGNVKAAARPIADVIRQDPHASTFETRPAIDIGVLGLRARALAQATWLGETIATSNGEASAPAAKTARELLDEMLPAAQRAQSLSWPWGNNFAGDSI